jgi:hypothetical protein
MMHPSELEDADWVPPWRLKENFRKCLKTGAFRNEV